MKAARASICVASYTAGYGSWQVNRRQKKCCLVKSSFSFLPFSSLHGKSRERSAVHSIATGASEPHAAPKASAMPRPISSMRILRAEMSSPRAGRADGLIDEAFASPAMKTSIGLDARLEDGSRASIQRRSPLDPQVGRAMPMESWNFRV